MFNLYCIKEVKLWYFFCMLLYDFYKFFIVMFLVEFLYCVLCEEVENGLLFVYLEYFIWWLDECDRSFFNFYLVFLMCFLCFFGLYFNMEDYREGCFFDMLNVCFVFVWLLYGVFLKLEEVLCINFLMCMNYEIMYFFIMSCLECNCCLVIMNDYYCLYLLDFLVLKLLDVLKELFL